MPGVQRPSVNLAAHSFQPAGLIRYHRGNLAIRNREALEDIACECYGIVKAQFERIM